MVNTDDTASAEETAVVLATTTLADTQGRVTIIPDSQVACRNFQRDSISAMVLALLHNTWKAEKLHWTFI